MNSQAKPNAMAPTSAARGSAWLTSWCCLACGASFVGWTALVTGQVHGLQAAYLLLLPFISCLTGGAGLGLVGMPASFSLALVAGCTLLSVCVTVLKILLPLTIVQCAVSTAVVAAVLAGRGRWSCRTRRGEVAAVLLCLAAATLWCRGSFRPFVMGDAAVILS